MKMLCLAAVFVLGSLLIFDDVLLAKEKYTQKKIDPSRVCGQKLDIDLSIGGRIREDYFFLNKPATFRGDLDDQFSYFRSKIEFQCLVKQGLEKYGVPASEAGIKFSHYGKWQMNSTYVRSTTKHVTMLKSLDSVVTGDAHDHSSMVPLVFVEDAWFKLNFGTFVRWLKNNPTFLKMGFFPYEVGRGFSLGTHEDVCLTYGGWQGDGWATVFPSMPPGILFHGKITDNIYWDFYYNKWKAFGEPVYIFESINRQKLTGCKPHRGVHKDRDTWVAKLTFKDFLEKYGKINTEPYFIYTNAPEQELELVSDAKSKLGTVGLYTDYTYKNFNINFEMAAQFGHQKVLAIDRNMIKLKQNKETGHVCEVFSHVVSRDEVGGDVMVMNADAEDPDFGSRDLLKIVNAPYNRAPERNGQNVVNSKGEDVAVRGGQIINSNNFGNARFRKEYKLNYQGLLGVVDIAYTFDNIPLKIAAAAGYIGGDPYPYNEEINKKYKGFIAQRAYSSGHHVKAILMFERQELARPLNISFRNFYAENNCCDYTNLQYIGASLTWNPLEKKQKLVINPNVVAFWEVGKLYKWDNVGKYPGGVGEKERKIEGYRNEFDFKGWTSDQKASKFLGVETNILVNYKILKNCDAYFKGYVFFSGQLYKDLQGQPNSFTIREQVNGKIKFNSLGTDNPWGFYTGFDYRF
jgi:hypothetical protein